MKRSLLVARAIEGAAGRGRTPKLDPPPFVRRRIQFEPFGDWYDIDWTHTFGPPLPVLRGATADAYLRHKLGH